MVATTDAVRGRSSSSAISPKPSPGPSAPEDAAVAHDVRRPVGQEPIGVADVALDDERRPGGRPLDLHALRQLFEDDEREGREQRIAAEEVQLASRDDGGGIGPADGRRADQRGNRKDRAGHHEGHPNADDLDERGGAREIRGRT